MEFVGEENLILQNFCQRVLARPRMLEQQLHTMKDGKLWCEDWEIIEILKYLFNGKEMYYLDPPPNRLKNNLLWSKEDIEQKALKLVEEYKTAQKIVDVLEKRRNEQL